MPKISSQVFHIHKKNKKKFFLNRAHKYENSAEKDENSVRIISSILRFSSKVIANFEVSNYLHQINEVANEQNKLISSFLKTVQKIRVNKQ